MNKITGISNGPPVLEPRKSEKPKTGLFEQNLEAARAKRQGVETPTGSTAPLGEVRPTLFPIISTPSATIANKTHRLLDLMETYAREMENPNKTLKEIEPLILSIQKKASQLMEDAGKTPIEDAKLGKIASECAVAANVEYIKFYRGDYI